MLHQAVPHAFKVHLFWPSGMWKNDVYKFSILGEKFLYSNFLNYLWLLARSILTFMTTFHFLWVFINYATHTIVTDKIRSIKKYMGAGIKSWYCWSRKCCKLELSLSWTWLPSVIFWRKCLEYMKSFSIWLSFFFSYNKW